MEEGSAGQQEQKNHDQLVMPDPCWGWGGFPCGSVVKNMFNPSIGRSPGGGNGNLLQYSCLENPMVRGVWWATVHRVAESQTRLSTHVEGEGREDWQHFRLL